MMENSTNAFLAFVAYKAWCRRRSMSCIYTHARFLRLAEFCPDAQALKLETWREWD